MDKKKRTAIVSVVAVLIVAIGAYWYVNYQIPHNAAVEAFNTAADGLQSRNDDLDAAIKELQELNKSKDKPYDSSTSDSATNAVAQAQAAKEDIPAMPGNTDEINTMAKKIDKMGKYDSVIGDLSTAKSNLQDSIDQLKQVTNPSEQFILQRALPTSRHWKLFRRATIQIISWANRAVTPHASTLIPIWSTLPTYILAEITPPSWTADAMPAEPSRCTQTSKMPKNAMST